MSAVVEELELAATLFEEAAARNNRLLVETNPPPPPPPPINKDIMAETTARTKATIQRAKDEIASRMDDGGFFPRDLFRN